ILANMYELGMGKQRDILQAINWYKKASQNGYGVASNNLGTIFWAGNNEIAPDKLAAKKWYSLAREQGFMHTPILKD
ncbi:MAG: hypothetical protein WA896_07895, partial [Spirulinaceae cyanobacterium]